MWKEDFAFNAVWLKVANNLPTQKCGLGKRIRIRPQSPLKIRPGLAPVYLCDLAQISSHVNLEFSTLSQSQTSDTSAPFRDKILVSAGRY